MPTARGHGAALLATGIAGAVALVLFNSNNTTKAMSNTQMSEPFATAKVELKENENEALVHTLLDHQGFQQNYSGIVAINEMADNLPQPMHLSDSAKSPAMLQNNCWLNQLSEQLDTSMADYKTAKGDAYVDGPVTKWSSAYANAAGDVGLQDTGYLKVASAKARFDGLFFYIKISHTVDVCAYKNDVENINTVEVDPTLFMPLTEAMCDKSKAAKHDFETGAGQALLAGAAASPECGKFLPKFLPMNNTRIREAIQAFVDEEWDHEDLTSRRGEVDFMHSPKAEAKYGPVAAWDVSAVTNMRFLFRDFYRHNVDVSAWDVSAVTNMYGLFNGCTTFNADVSAWDVSAVTNMVWLFNECWSFNGDVSAWDVSAVTEMSGLFMNCKSFSANLSAWEVGADMGDLGKLNNMFHLVPEERYLKNAPFCSFINDASKREMMEQYGLLPMNWCI